MSPTHQAQVGTNRGPKRIVKQRRGRHAPMTLTQIRRHIASRNTLCTLHTLPQNTPVEDQPHEDPDATKTRPKLGLACALKAEKQSTQALQEVANLQDENLTLRRRIVVTEASLLKLNNEGTAQAKTLGELKLIITANSKEQQNMNKRLDRLTNLVTSVHTKMDSDATKKASTAQATNLNRAAPATTVLPPLAPLQPTAAHTTTTTASLGHTLGGAPNPAGPQQEEVDLHAFMTTLSAEDPPLDQETLHGEEPTLPDTMEAGGSGLNTSLNQEDMYYPDFDLPEDEDLKAELTMEQTLMTASMSRVQGYIHKMQTTPLTMRELKEMADRAKEAHIRADSLHKAANAENEYAHRLTNTTFGGTYKAFMFQAAQDTFLMKRQVEQRIQDIERSNADATAKAMEDRGVATREAASIATRAAQELAAQQAAQTAMARQRLEQRRMALHAELALLGEEDPCPPAPTEVRTTPIGTPTTIPTQQPQGKTPSLPLPAKYSGRKEEDLDSALFSFENYLRGNKIPESDWPRHAMNLLTGKALEAYMAFALPLNKRGEDITWEQFTCTLSTAFTTHDKMLEARAALLTCQQTDTLTAYQQHFRMLLAKAGDPHPTDKDLLLLYWKGLKTDIKEAAKLNPTTGAFWETFEELAAHTTILARQHTMNMTPKGPPRDRSHHALNKWNRAKLNALHTKRRGTIHPASLKTATTQQVPPAPHGYGGYGGRGLGGRSFGGGTHRSGGGRRGGRGRSPFPPPPTPHSTRCVGCGGGAGYHMPKCPNMSK